MLNAKPYVAAASLALAGTCRYSAPPPAEQARETPQAVPLAVSEVRPGIVDGVTAHRLVAEGKVVVVDVRTPREFEAGHVPAAKNIPVDQIAARADEIGPPSTPVLLYCHSGYRSGIALEALQRKGYSALYDMRSLTAWEKTAPHAQSAR